MGNVIKVTLTLFNLLNLSSDKYTNISWGVSIIFIILSWDKTTSIDANSSIPLMPTLSSI